MRQLVPLLAVLPALAACAAAAPRPTPAEPTVAEAHGIAAVAEAYVRLVLAVGRHDPAYVDAYYGPAAWREEVEAGEPATPDRLRAEAAALRDLLAGLPAASDPLEAMRARFLDRQLEAVEARLAMLAGERLDFDAESQALYDAVAPTHDLEAEFGPVLARLDAALPGEGELTQRYLAFKERYVVPPDRVHAVFEAAIAECRRRTARHVPLPEGEQFTLELVKDKPWGGYNWYQGGFESLIQINVSLPVGIGRAVDVACHEGYPGHHAYNALLEKHLVRDRGWVEMTVYPLYSPQSLIAEGTANFGIEVAFPGDTRQRFEREVLYPLAGLDPATADAWSRVETLTERLDWAGNEIGRRYVNGLVDAAQASALLEKWLLMTPEHAAQRIRFLDAYRSYVINYNLGAELVQRWVEVQGGTAENPERRWEVFVDLISSPRLPSDLAAE